MKNVFLSLLIFLSISLFAQQDSSRKVTLSAYGEMYYSYDFSNPRNHEKANFIYNHKRHNELNANLLLIKANYNDKNTRANIGLMAGTYPQYNLSSEPTWAQFIYEANIGVRLSKKKDLWLDAGIMPSHIGFESAIGADCWTLTRSMCAENSPYFETGLRLQYISNNEKLTASFLVLNGWQKIQKPAAIQRPSIGLQLNYKLNDKMILNYSNYIGSDQPDRAKALRTYHNLFVQYQASNKLGIIAGLDIGTDKSADDNYGAMIAPVIIARYSVHKKMNIAMRAEYYYDREQVFIATNTLSGFQVFGLSANTDYKLNDKALFRLEGKMFNAQNHSFENKSNYNYSITSSLCIQL